MVESREELETGLKEAEEEIERHEKHLKELRDKKWALQRVIWKIRDAFKCPEGLSNTDAVCPGCRVAMPNTANHMIRRKDIEDTDDWANIGHTMRFTLPGEQCDFDGVDLEGRYCTEWTKKIKRDVCGCGGMSVCSCGYSHTYCFPTEEPRNCPHCDRPIHAPTTSQSYAYRGIDVISIHGKIESDKPSEEKKKPGE